MKHWLGLIALTGTLSIPALAQEPAPTQTAPPAVAARTGKQKNAANPQRMLKRMDANLDGKLAQDEWKGKPEGFARLDKDSDGFVTASEIQVTQVNAKNGFAKLDANGDGKIAREEWKGKPKGFDKMDANADGALTPDELGKMKGRKGKGKTPAPATTPPQPA